MNIEIEYRLHFKFNILLENDCLWHMKINRKKFFHSIFFIYKVFEKKKNQNQIQNEKKKKNENAFLSEFDWKKKNSNIFYITCMQSYTYLNRDWVKKDKCRFSFFFWDIDVVVCVFCVYLERKMMVCDTDVLCLKLNLILILKFFNI